MITFNPKDKVVSLNLHGDEYGLEMIANLTTEKLYPLLRAQLLEEFFDEKEISTLLYRTLPDGELDLRDWNDLKTFKANISKDEWRQVRPFFKEIYNWSNRVVKEWEGRAV